MLGKHIDLSGSQKILGAVSQSGVWKKGNVHKIYLSHVRTLLNYVGVA